MGSSGTGLLDADLRIISEMTKAVTSTLDLAEIVRIVLAQLKSLAAAEAISLLRYDAERDELVFAATETLREATFAEAPAQSGLASWVARTGRTARVDDAAADPRCSGFALASAEGRRLLAAPVWRDDRVVGVLELADPYHGLPFRPEDEAALERVATAIATRCDLARLPGDAHAVRALLAEVTAAVPSQAAALLLIDPSGRGVTLSASRRLETGVVDGLRMPADAGIAGWVARHREPVLLDDASADPRWHRELGAKTHFRPRAMLCVPILNKDTLLGVIQVMNRSSGRRFDMRQLRLAQIFADHTGIAIQNARLFRELNRTALTDDLTGHGNARALTQTLAALVGRGEPVALLVLDFDNFKEVVDRHGHPIGGQTLAYMGRVMAAHLRQGDHVARFGGDEFAVVLPATELAAALDVAEAIRGAIAATRQLDGHAAVDLSRVTVSVGVAVHPVHAADDVGLLRAADQAMFAVKRATKNAVGIAELDVAPAIREGL